MNGKDGKMKGTVFILQQVLNFVYKLPEEGRDVPKQVAVLKDCTDMFCLMCICLVS
jgi:hypothetical protein